MKMKLYRIASLLLAVMLLALPLCAAAEEDEEPDPLFFHSDDALGEEDSSSVFEVVPGSYEWYMLPSDIEDDHAYVDVSPVEETVTMKKGVWNYAFQLEEVGGVSFYPYSVILVGFCDGTEISRTVLKKDSGSWWVGEIPADSLVTYTGTDTNEYLTAMAISLIGTDETGYELEFHGMVFFAH